MTAMEEILARFGKQATAFSPPPAPSKPTPAAKTLAPKPPMVAKSAADAMTDAERVRLLNQGRAQIEDAARRIAPAKPPPKVHPQQAPSTMPSGQKLAPAPKLAADFKDAVARRRGVTGMPQAGQAERPIKTETGMKGESVTPKGERKYAMHGAGGATTDRQFSFLAASLEQQKTRQAVKKAEVEGKKIPKKVKEIADAVREENPKMPDATAYRIAWDQFKDQTGGPTTGPKTGYGKAAELMAYKVAAWTAKLSGVNKMAQDKEEKRMVEPAVLRGALYGAAKSYGSSDRSYRSQQLMGELMSQWRDQKLSFDEAAMIVGKAVLAGCPSYPMPLRREEETEDLEQLSKMSAAVKLARELTTSARGTYKGASVNKSDKLLDDIVAIARRT